MPEKSLSVMDRFSLNSRLNFFNPKDTECERGAQGDELSARAQLVSRVQQLKKNKGKYEEIKSFE